MRYEKKIWAIEDELASLAYDSSDTGRRRRNEILHKLEEIRARVLSVADPTLRLLLIKRIIERKSWSRIAVEMGYSESHIYRLRCLALLALGDWK